MQTRGSKAREVALDLKSSKDLANPECPKILLTRLQRSYGGLKSREAEASKKALPSLHIDGLSEEQIWQQIELQNRAGLSVLRRTNRAIGPSPSLFAHSVNLADRNESLSDPDSDPELPGPSSRPAPEKKKKKEKAKKDVKTVKHGIEDQFFSLEAMEKFCEEAEADNFLTGDVDFGKASGGGDELFYNDFFDEPEGDEEEEEAGWDDPMEESDHNSDEDEWEGWEEPERKEEESELGETSRFKRQKALSGQVEELEEEAMAAKPWQMAGEVAAGDREENGLLGEHLEFQANQRSAPIITAEWTEKLEALIMQRIRDGAFDDVERKAKPQKDAAVYRAELVLDQEKSKVSLADVYEKEFLKQTGATDDVPTPGNTKADEIRTRMGDLFRRLDALANYHQAPPPAQAQLKVIRREDNEDIVSGPLAPEEIRAPGVGDLKAAEEESGTEKKRARRLKKAKQKARAAKAAEGKPVIQGKVKKAKKDSGLAGGKDFFSKLKKVQEEPETKKKKKSKAKQNSAAAYKLL